MTIQERNLMITGSGYVIVEEFVKDVPEDGWHAGDRMITGGIFTSCINAEQTLQTDYSTVDRSKPYPIFGHHYSKYYYMGCTKAYVGEINVVGRQDVPAGDVVMEPVQHD